VLRDGQQYVAPLALAEAIGLGAVVAWVIRDAAVPAAATPQAGTGGGVATAPRHARAAAALGVMATLAPVLLLPGMAWGSAGRLKPAQYPADWSRARRIIDGDPAAGPAVLLPWAAYRRYPWNGGEALYDPWPRLLHREVIANDALQVGSQTVGAESTDSIRLGRIIAAPGALTRPLLAAGVRYVIVDGGPLLTRPGPDLADRARLPGASVVLASRDLVIFRLPARPAGRG
jgi:hypothetical protein